MYNRIKVFPRKKAGQEEKNQPFFVSTLDLNKMFHLSLKEAAEQLGISLTGMKNTCKRLGVRWPTISERLQLQEERKAGGLEELMLAATTVRLPEESSMVASPQQPVTAIGSKERMCSAETAVEQAIGGSGTKQLPCGALERGSWAWRSGIGAAYKVPTLGVEEIRSNSVRGMQGSGQMLGGGQGGEMKGWAARMEGEDGAWRTASSTDSGSRFGIGGEVTAWGIAGETAGDGRSEEMILVEPLESESRLTDWEEEGYVALEGTWESRENGIRVSELQFSSQCEAPP